MCFNIIYVNMGLSSLETDMFIGLNFIFYQQVLEKLNKGWKHGCTYPVVVAFDFFLFF